MRYLTTLLGGCLLVACQNRSSQTLLSVTTPASSAETVVKPVITTDSVRHDSDDPAFGSIRMTRPRA